MCKTVGMTLIFSLFVGGICLAQSLVPLDPASLDGHVYLLEDETDSSANGNTANLVGAPQVVDGLSGKAMQLNGTSDGLHLPDAALINTSAHQNHTVIAVFNCADVTKSAYQCIYEEGGSTRGLSINVEAGLVYAGAWNRADYTPQWNPGTFFSAPIGSNEWHVVAAVVRDGSTAQEDDKFEMWMDGVLIGRGPGGQLNSRSDDNAIGNVQAQTIFNGTIVNAGHWFEGIIDEVWIINEALDEGVLSALGPSPTLAKDPSPANGATDVERDLVISWTPGKYATKHNVYLGTDFTDVNEAAAGVLIAENLDVNSIDPGRLDLGATYYLRIDEVNSAPDFTVFAGEVWEFTIEPHGRPIDNLTVTASSSQAADMGPEKTIDGSCINGLDQHSTEPTDMWLSGIGDPAPWIQYDFDKVYKLDEMLVWNSNQAVESFVGLGAKDVVIETSMDGADWTVLEGATLFNQAPGKVDYVANTTIGFGGILAQSVRITITAGYGFLPQYGLSEVCILYIPTFAREPEPAPGSMVSSANVMLGWRSGREAASSEVYLGTDPADLPLAGTTTATSFAADGLSYSTTYYWSITEVNEAETPTAHAGDVWSFTTPDFGVVESFDQYDDNCERIFFAWEDGLGHNGGTEIDDCDVPPSNGNGGGSIVGNDQAPFAERTIVRPGSTQSMPFNYDNSFGPSEATLRFDAQDWTASGVQTLAIAFHGTEGNTGTLYVKINNTKILYDRDPAHIAVAGWLAWNIDLTSVGGLQNVSSLTIGVDGGNAAGMLYIDDIRLYPLAGELITPADPGTNGLVAKYSFENNANDSSGNGVNGTLEGGASYAAGKVGSALDCGGFDGFVSTGQSASTLGIDGNKARTVTCWAFTRAFNNGGLYDVGARTAGQDFCLRTLATDGDWRVQYWGGAFDIDFSLDALERWIHFTHVYDGAATQIYANGILVASGPGVLDTADTNPWQIGVYGWQNDFFDGLIDELHLFNRALSAEEALFMAGNTQPIHKPF